MASQRKFQTPAKSYSVNQCHDWFGASLDQSNNVWQTRGLECLIEFADIRSGTECATFTAKNRALDLAIGHDFS